MLRTAIIASLISICFTGTSMTEVARPSVPRPCFAVFSDVLYRLSYDGAIKFSSSADRGLKFSAPVTVGRESGCSLLYLSAGSDMFSAYWITEEKLFLSRSFDKGSTWKQPVPVSSFEKGPTPAAIAGRPDALCSVYKDPVLRTLVFRISTDNGSSWRPYGAIQLAAYDIGDPKLALYKDKLFCLWHSGGNGSSYLMLASRSFNEASWSVSTVAGPLSNRIDDVSLCFSDFGAILIAVRSANTLLLAKNLEPATASMQFKNYLIPYESSSLNICSINTCRGGVLAALSYDRIFDISFPVGTAPSIRTAEGRIYASSEAVIEITPLDAKEEIKYSLSYGTDPALMSSTVFFQKNSSGAVISGLKDGTYHYFVTAQNGLSSVSSKPRSIVIDTTPPAIFILSPAGDISTEAKEITLSGTTEPYCQVKINGAGASIHSKGGFETKVPLKPGTNILTVESTDPAGNTASVLRKVFLSSFSSELALTRPTSKDFFKPGCIFAIEASPLPGTLINDGEEAAIRLNGITLESSVIYDGESGILNGFSKIPLNFANETGLLTISLRDRNGSEKKAALNIKLDTKGPQVLLPLAGSMVYSNRTDLVTVPLKDEGSGADLLNSKVKLFKDNITVEASASSDKSSSSVVLLPRYSLSDGLYLLEVTPRDLAGNSGPPQRFNYAVDTKAPQITLNSDLPSESTVSSIIIEGRSNKPHISSVTVTQNGSSAKNISVKGDSFSLPLRLEDGTNIICITLCDAAGNRSSLSRRVFYLAPPQFLLFNFDGVNISNGEYVAANPVIKITDAAGSGVAEAKVKLDGTAVTYDTSSGRVTASALSNTSHTLTVELPEKTYEISFMVDTAARISNVLACPNPYDPSAGDLSVTFNCSKVMTVTLMVFDIRGSLILRKEAAAATGFNDSLKWDGKNCNGETAANGTYILDLVARDASGASSVSKGKVIVLR